MIKKIVLLIISTFPNKIKIYFYSFFLNAEISSNVQIGFGTILDAKFISIGHGSRVGRFNKIKVKQLRLGQYCRIGDSNLFSTNSIEMKDRSTIASNVSVTGGIDDPGSVLKIGMHSWIFDHCYIDTSRSVTLGRNVGVGGRTLIFTHGYWLSVLDGYPISYGDVEIGDDVWIPWDCFINSGVKIGPGVILGARTLVNKSLPSDCLAVGIPGKVIREKIKVDRTPEEKITLLYNIFNLYIKEKRISFTSTDKYNSREIKLDDKSLAIVFSTSEKNVDVSNFKQRFYFLSHFCDDAFFSKNLAYSVIDYKCSSYQRLPVLIRSFFEYARSQGIRFYPYDES